MSFKQNKQFTKAKNNELFSPLSVKKKNSEMYLIVESTSAPTIKGQKL